MPLLSICIPTYNRAQFLPETFESILSQWDDDLEITIADNASTDGTEALVQGYQQRHESIRYFRWDSNQGADRNYLKCVELATGRYCLILGSDDALLPGAIAVLRKILQSSSPSLVLFNRQTCTKDMAPLRVEQFLEVGNDTGRSFDFREPGVMDAYFGCGKSLCAAFSYLSSVLFEKRLWDGVETEEEFIGSAYIHTQKLLGACGNIERLEYVNAPLVKCRLGFDSFRHLGIANRVLLDLDGYDHLIKRYFEAERPACAVAIRRMIRLEYPFGRLLRYQGVTGQEPHWPEALEKLVSHYHYSAWKLRLATLLGRSRALVRLSFFLRDLRDRIRVHP